MKRSEQGSVLLLALLVTLIILGIGLTVMWVASSGSKMSGNITRRQEALYAAETGIEQARAILFATGASADWSPYLEGCKASRNSTVIGNVLCTGGTTGTALQYQQVIPTNSETDKKVSAAPIVGGAGLKNINYTVWIRNDLASENCVQITKSGWDCNDDGSVDTKSGSLGGASDPLVDKNHRVILRAEGVGRDGISTINVEVVVSRPGALITATSYSQAGMNAQGSNSAGAVLAP